jgi:hypothetical protein
VQDDRRRGGPDGPVGGAAAGAEGAGMRIAIVLLANALFWTALWQLACAIAQFR